MQTGVIFVTDVKNTFKLQFEKNYEIISDYVLIKNILSVFFRKG